MPFKKYSKQRMACGAIAAGLGLGLGFTYANLAGWIPASYFLEIQALFLSGVVPSAGALGLFIGSVVAFGLLVGALVLAFKPQVKIWKEIWTPTDQQGEKKYTIVFEFSSREDLEAYEQALGAYLKFLETNLVHIPSMIRNLDKRFSFVAKKPIKTSVGWTFLERNEQVVEDDIVEIRRGGECSLRRLEEQYDESRELRLPKDDKAIFILSNVETKKSGRGDTSAEQRKRKSAVLSVLALGVVMGLSLTYLNVGGLIPASYFVDIQNIFQAGFSAGSLGLFMGLVVGAIAVVALIVLAYRAYPKTDLEEKEPKQGTTQPPFEGCLTQPDSQEDAIVLACRAYPKTEPRESSSIQNDVSRSSGGWISNSSRNRPYISIEYNFYLENRVIQIQLTLTGPPEKRNLYQRIRTVNDLVEHKPNLGGCTLLVYYTPKDEDEYKKLATLLISRHHKRALLDRISLSDDADLLSQLKVVCERLNGNLMAADPTLSFMLPNENDDLYGTTFLPPYLPEEPSTLTNEEELKNPPDSNLRDDSISSGPNGEPLSSLSQPPDSSTPVRRERYAPSTRESPGRPVLPVSEPRDETPVPKNPPSFPGWELSGDMIARTPAFQRPSDLMRFSTDGQQFPPALLESGRGEPGTESLVDDPIGEGAPPFLRLSRQCSSTAQCPPSEGCNRATNPPRKPLTP